MLALIAPYDWPVSRFFADALTASNPNPEPAPAVTGSLAGRARSIESPPDDPMAVAALLDPEGPLANVLPGYEHRESQMQMLLAVAQIQARGGALVVEAGAGEGGRVAHPGSLIAPPPENTPRGVGAPPTHP